MNYYEFLIVFMSLLWVFGIGMVFGLSIGSDKRSEEQ